MAFNVSYIYQVMDRYSGPLDRISKKSKQFNRILAKSAAQLKKVNGKLAEHRGKILAAGTAMGAVSVLALKNLGQAASQAEDKMADLTRVIDFASNKEFAAFQKRIGEVSRPLGVASDDFAALAFETKKFAGNLDKMGVITATGEIIKMAAAWDMNRQAAVEAYGSILNKTGYSLKQMGQLADSINYVGDTTGAQVKNVIRIIARQPAIFGKFSAQVAAGWGAVTDQLSATPEVGATGFKMLVQRLKQMSPKMAHAMVDDPNKAILGFLKNMQKMPEVTRNAFLFKKFGAEAEPFVSGLIKNLKLVEYTLGKAMDAKAIGSVNAEFAKMQKRSSFLSTVLSAVFKDLRVELGKNLLPHFNKVVMYLSEIGIKAIKFLQANPKWAKLISLAIALAVVFSGLLITTAALSYAFTTLKLATVAMFIITKSIAIATKIWTAAQWLLNAAMSANPISLIVIGIAALITGVALLINHWDKVKAAMISVWGVINKNPFLDFMTNLVPFILLPKLLIKHWSKIKNLFSGIGGVLKRVGGAIGNIFGGDTPGGMANGVSREQAVKSTKAEFNVSMSGQIGVKSADGSQVTEAEIYNNNNGTNLAYAGGM